MMTDHLSKHWPSHYHGKIPTRVRMTCHLGPDFWGILHPGTPRIWLSHGEEYLVKCNQHGALSVLTVHGELGIKPSEHEIIEWREPGEDVSGALPVGSASGAAQAAPKPTL